MTKNLIVKLQKANHNQSHKLTQGVKVRIYHGFRCFNTQIREGGGGTPQNVTALSLCDGISSCPNLSHVTVRKKFLNEEQK